MIKYDNVFVGIMEHRTVPELYPPSHEQPDQALLEVYKQLLESDTVQYNRWYQRLLDEHVVADQPTADYVAMRIPVSPYNFDFASAVALQNIGYQVTISDAPGPPGKHLIVSSAPDDFETIKSLIMISHVPGKIFKETLFVEQICNGTLSPYDTDENLNKYRITDVAIDHSQDVTTSIQRGFITGLVIWQAMNDNGASTDGPEIKTKSYDPYANLVKFGGLRRDGYTPYNVEKLYSIVEDNIVRRISAMKTHAKPPAQSPQPNQ
jgi:hypothetical protein